MNKQHILDEIKRTAKENGGRPLGKQRFESATGIREHQWRGVFSARWNDAVAEAGLAPNALVAAHDENHLLEKVAGLALELQDAFQSPERNAVKTPQRSTFPDDGFIL